MVGRVAVGLLDPSQLVGRGVELVRQCSGQNPRRADVVYIVGTNMPVVVERVTHVTIVLVRDKI